MKLHLLTCFSVMQFSAIYITVGKNHQASTLKAYVKICYQSLQIIITADFFLLQSELPEGLNQTRLKSILQGYGEYPAKYRYRQLHNADMVVFQTFHSVLKKPGFL